MRIKTVSLYVTDQERSRDFYVERLGFEVRQDASMGPKGRWLEIAPPGAESGFVLAEADAFGRRDRVGDSADLVLTCEDVVALHADLVAAEVSVTEPDKQAWGTYIKVTDPDGLQVVLTQPNEQS